MRQTMSPDQRQFRRGPRKVSKLTTTIRDKQGVLESQISSSSGQSSDRLAKSKIMTPTIRSSITRPDRRPTRIAPRKRRSRRMDNDVIRVASFRPHSLVPSTISSSFLMTASLLLIGLVVVGSQHETTSLPKAGQRQQIFHQNSPSQQLASSNNIDLGDLNEAAKSSSGEPSNTNAAGGHHQQRLQLLLAMRAVPISARGALSFVSSSGSSGQPPPPSPSIVLYPKCSSSSPSSSSSATASLPTSGSPLSSSMASGSKKFATNAMLAPDARQQPTSVTEVIAVEGTSLKLNLAILGHSNSNQQQQYYLHQLQPASRHDDQHHHNNNNNLEQQQQLRPGPLRLHWQHDGQLISDLNLARARFSSVQLASESDSETIAQLLGLNGTHSELGSQQASTTSSNGRAEQQFQWLSMVDQQQQQQATNQNDHEQHQQQIESGFIQFPFVNEQQLERLERGPAHQTGLMSVQARQSVANTLKRLGHDKSAAAAASMGARALKRDNFLADGQSIDWRRLGLYLKQTTGHPLLLDQQQQHETISPECGKQPQSLLDSKKQTQPAPRLEQLMIVQLEIGQLRVQDRGQYQLYVCQQIVSVIDQQQQTMRSASGGAGKTLGTGDCLQSQLLATIALQVVEDVPRLEAWFEPQLLNQGDRFSIKCEATGFTLPQISWFLDGQLLSEHHGSGAGDHLNAAGSGQRSFGIMQQLDDGSVGGSNGAAELTGTMDHLNHNHLQQQHQLFGSSQRSLISASQSFRIGDYVSQDNHVHSFVNSSSARLADGGFYKCQANNGLHEVEHEARIDVRGPANIGRPMGYNVSTLVGSAHLALQCPYSGHPVGPIEWYFRPTGARHTVGNGPMSTAVTGGDQQQQQQSPDYLDMYLGGNGGGNSAALHQLKGRTLRQKRRPFGEALVKPPKTTNEPENGAGYNEYNNNNNDNVNSNNEENDDEYLVPAAPSGERARGARLLQVAVLADDQQQQSDVPDPDRDEWLEQASSMTMPPSPEDYPEPLPDYPIPVLDDEGAGGGGGNGEGLGGLASSYPTMALLDNLASDGQQQEFELTDDYGDSNSQQRLARTRRAADIVSQDEHHNQQQLTDNKWIKLPQSRRHQVHPNGTLAIHDIQQDDQGAYKCHVLAPASQQQQQQSVQEQAMMMQLSTWSNELQLAVLVPPVISPFGSSESLREGMRNFLTCSVIEGDSPVRLSWLKDGRPIEEHIARAGTTTTTTTSASTTTNMAHGSFIGGQRQHQQPLPSSLSAGSIPDGNNNNNNNGSSSTSRRIKVETSNEYTSTLYFSQVDFRDNGNYTCVATNKAASVNYTARMVVNVPPKWTKSPKDVESVAGQNIVIDCQAEAHPNPRIWWEIGVSTPAHRHQQLDQQQQQQQQHANKLDEFGHPSRLASGQQQLQQQQLDIGSSGLEQPPNHYRTIISNSRTYILENASLVIRDVGKQDQGYYLCQAANNFGLLSALIKLTVNVGASFANKYQMKYVRLNERVELDCDPNGQAPVTVTWFVRNQQSSSSVGGGAGLGLGAGLAPIGNQLNQSFASASSPTATTAVSRHEQLAQFSGGGGGELETNNQSSLNYNHPHQYQYQQYHQQHHHRSSAANQGNDDDSDADDQRLALEAGAAATGPGRVGAAGRRRLYTGTIQTDLPVSQSSPASQLSNNQAAQQHYNNHHHNHHQQQQPPLLASNSLSPQQHHVESPILIGTADTAAAGPLGANSQPAGKLIEIDSSISFEILKSRQVGAAGSGQATPQSSIANNQQQQLDIVGSHSHPSSSSSSSSSSPSTHHSNSNGGGEIVRLHIKQARRSNSGEYICHAANQFGSDEKLIKLLVQEPPDPIREISALHIDSRSISIAWPAPFNGNSPITSYTVEWIQTNSNNNNNEASAGQVDSSMMMVSGSELSSGQQQQPHSAARWSQMVVQQPAATIGQLQPMTSYEIRVIAHNQFGRSSAMPHNNGGPVTHSMQSLVVTTSEEAPVAPPSDIKALALSSSSVQVSWLPPSGGSVAGVGSSIVPSNLDDNMDTPTSNNNNNRQADHQIRSTLANSSKLTAGQTRLGKQRGAAGSSSSSSSSNSIKGYYLGYKVANSNESFIFKTVSVPQPVSVSGGIGPGQTTGQLALVGSYLPQLTSSHDPHQHRQATAPSSSLDSGSTVNQATNSDSPARVRVLIGDLKRSTKYSIIVQAYNSAGPGPQSDPIEVRTLLNDPPPAPALRVGLTTASSLELQWSFRQIAPDLLSQDSAQMMVAHQQEQDDTTDIPTFESVSTNSASGKSPPSGSPGDNKQLVVASIIDGYHLYYRPVGASVDGALPVAPSHEWQERRLTQETHTIVPSPIIQTVGNGASTGDSQILSSSASSSSSVVGGNGLSGHQLPDLSIIEQQPRPSPSGTPQISSSWSRFHGSNASLSQRTFRYLLDQLVCGNFYQVYLVAYNSYGTGQPSQVIRAKTRGSAPIAPRRQQDFIQANTTLVKLNLAAWQDGGCSLTNFEIKYKQLRNRAAAISMLSNHMGMSTHTSSSSPTTSMSIMNSLSSASTTNQQQQQLPAVSSGVAPSTTNNHPSDGGDWLLLSNNISPEQRSIELRDLQPETWYGIWVTAESVAGKSNVQYAFMTLDKFGQLPSEALEPLPSSINGNLPALFRSGAGGGGSIRSILYSLSSGGPNGFAVPPLVLSASLCLIIFATCSLFLIKRYNNLVKDDQSIDLSSPRTGASMMTSDHNSNNNSNTNSKAYQLNGHGMQAQNTKHQSLYHYAKPNEETRSISPMDPHYSMRVSPCRTGATVITNSSSSTNGSSGALLLGASSSICDSAAVAYGMRPEFTNDLVEHQLQQQQQQQQQVPMDHLSQFVASSTMNYRDSRLLEKCCGQEHKFSTMARGDTPGQQQQQHMINTDNGMANLQSSYFRTLPHSSLRPVSTFLPPSSMQNTNNQPPHSGCPMNGSSADEADYQQRQIYSKLRLLQHYSAAAAAAANNCSPMCQQQQQQQQQQADHETVMALNQLYGQTGISLDEQHQTQNGTNTTNNGMPQQPAGSTNEQDDYALPFPPKWV